MRHLSDLDSHGYDHIAHHNERQARIACRYAAFNTISITFKIVLSLSVELLFNVHYSNEWYPCKAKTRRDLFEANVQSLDRARIIC